MRTNHPIFRLLAALPLVTFLVGCAASTPTLAPTEPPAATATPAATRTAFPTETPWPSRTPTVTATLPPTETPMPTADPALSGVVLVGLAWYDNYDMHLSFRFPGPVQPDGYLVTLEDKPYKCEVGAAQPDLLICRGQGGQVYRLATVKVYQAGAPEPGFEKEISVPFFDNKYDSLPR